MKKIILLAVCAFSLSAKCASFKKRGNHTVTVNSVDDTVTHSPKGAKMKINIGSHTFTVTLFDNPSAAAFKALLPLTIDMVELNRNEKYYDLPKNLPVNGVVPARIKNGDLMLYGSSTLVLFYKEFDTSYRYTKLGQIDDPNGLANALGSKNVKVAFQLN